MDDFKAEHRIAKLPEPIRDRVAENDPYWCFIPDGWRDLVVELDKELRVVDPDYVLSQCKEKFGGLRYYVDFSDDCEDWQKGEDIISTYEEISAKTCDVCGNPGQIKSINGWLSARCEEHEAKERK